MKFQLATDYTIRILCYLYENKNQLFKASDLSQELGITYLYFMKLTGVLKQAHLIDSVQGRGGGYLIAKGAEETTLFDIVTLIEGDICLNRCLEEDKFCSRNAVSWCPAHIFFEGLQGEFIAKLQSKRIRDLCNLSKTNTKVPVLSGTDV